MLPAVQKIESQATTLEATLDGLGTGSGASFKTEVVYLGLDAAFTTLENNLVIAGANLAFQKVAPGPIDFLKIRLDEFFINVLTPPDPAVQAQLGGVVSEANTILAGLAGPSDTGGGGTTTLATAGDI